MALMKHIYDNERGFEILSFRGHPGSCWGSAVHKHYIISQLTPVFFPFVYSHRSSEQGSLFVSAIENDVLTSELGSSESSPVSLVACQPTLRRHYSAGT